jgi:hypothetical protein
MDKIKFETLYPAPSNCPKNVVDARPMMGNSLPAKSTLPVITIYLPDAQVPEFIERYRKSSTEST